MRTILVCLLLLLVQPLIAQCSDAGVCVIGSKNETPEHRIRASYGFGKSTKTDDLTFHSIHIEGSFQIFHDSRVSIIFPWSRASGPLGSAHGIGDITILWNQSLLSTNDNRLTVQLGGKFASGSANAANLPQAYQPGLGTSDLLLGISYETTPLLFALGYQRSRGRSNNSLMQLQRGDDLFGRMGYTTFVSDLTVAIELLGIKRLQESSVLNTAIPGGSSFVSVPGSDQFQANILGTVALPLDTKYALQFMGAVPLRSRKVNLDGLTRSVSLAMSVQYSF